ncbi:MAG TPA: hypothetical protein DD417_19990 [Elusimicrobia bacterium]|nr:hypothetical protein [Elusimicrobiota bacterium]
MNRILALFLLTAVLAARPGAALEVSLEENRAQRGNIGYVDIQRVFRLYPETRKAKQSYAEIVRQAEEQVNLKKAELIGLRGELSRLRAEREVVAKTPIVTTPPPAPVPPPAPLPETGAEDPGQPPAAATAPVAGSDFGSLPGMAGEVRPATATVRPLVINIPGVTDSPIVVQPPGGTETPETVAASSPAVSGAQADLQEALRSAAALAPPPPSARLAELDEEIAAKEKDLAAKEKAFRTFEGDVEKNLIAIEGKRSEMLLGKIYRAVREAARENGVSVVVDKSQILFGQDSVDLTDKVIRKLEGLQP